MSNIIEGLLITAFILVMIIAGNMTYYEYFDNQHEDYMFEKIAKHVASDYKHIENVFDCSQFSQELYNRLLYAGYKQVRIDAGCNDEMCHCWVILTLGNEDIYIESTSGDILNKKYYIKEFPVQYGTIKNSVTKK